MPLKDCGILNLRSTVTKSVKKRKRLDFLTILKLSNVCVFKAQWGAGGVYSGVQVTGMTKWGKNQNPQKSLGLKTRPKELPGPNNQQKNSVPSHENFQEELNDITIMNPQIVLNTQNNPYLNQAAQ